MVEYMMKALKMSLNTVRMRAKRLLKDCVIEKCDKIVECKCKKFYIKRIGLKYSKLVHGTLVHYENKNLYLWNR